jgi:hypothetical protein
MIGKTNQYSRTEYGAALHHRDYNLVSLVRWRLLLLEVETHSRLFAPAKTGTS